jgi:hypothetical protein
MAVLDTAIHPWLRLHYQSVRNVSVTKTQTILVR